jgi:hypothetical protein
MIAAAHSDCLVCMYWQSRIAEEKARAQAGCADAFDKEKRVRGELAQHRERNAELEAVNDAQTR